MVKITSSTFRGRGPVEAGLERGSPRRLADRFLLTVPGCRAASRHLPEVPGAPGGTPPSELRLIPPGRARGGVATQPSAGSPRGGFLAFLEPTSPPPATSRTPPVYALAAFVAVAIGTVFDADSTPAPACPDDVLRSPLFQRPKVHLPPPARPWTGSSKL